MPQLRAPAAQPGSIVLSATEGGIPPAVGFAIQLVAGEEVTQSQPSTAIANDVRVGSVPLADSLAIPEPGPPVEQPANWPSDVRNVPNYRPQEVVVFSTRPMEQNTGEIHLPYLDAFRSSGNRLSQHCLEEHIGQDYGPLLRYAPGGSY